jgi:hypothetical protein
MLRGQEETVMFKRLVLVCVVAFISLAAYGADYSAALNQFKGKAARVLAYGGIPTMMTVVDVGTDYIQLSFTARNQQTVVMYVPFGAISDVRINSLPGQPASTEIRIR